MKKPLHTQEFFKFKEACNRLSELLQASSVEVKEALNKTAKDLGLMLIYSKTEKEQKVLSNGRLSN
jgi:hypothetical protein